MSTNVSDFKTAARESQFPEVEFRESWIPDLQGRPAIQGLKNFRIPAAFKSQNTVTTKSIFGEIEKNLFVSTIVIIN